MAKSSRNSNKSSKTARSNVTDVPVADVPVADVPVADVPVTDVPVTDVPVTDVPVTDVPVTDVPVADVPVADVPVPVAVTDVPVPVAVAVIVPQARKLPPVITTSEKGQDWFPYDDLRLSQVVSMQSKNRQRIGYDYLMTGNARELQLSLAYDGFVRAKGLPSVEPYSRTVHGAQYAIDQSNYETWLVEQLAQASTGAKPDEVKAWQLQESLTFFRKTYKDEQGNWREPEFVAVGGNTRWLEIIIANGIRIAMGLPPIEEFPAMCFVRTLLPSVRTLEQMLENDEDRTTTKPSTDARIRTMRQYLGEVLVEANGDKTVLPIQRKKYRAALSSITGIASTTKTAENLFNLTRPAVVLDFLFPEANILQRLGAKDDLSPEQPKLVHSVAFGQSKSGQTTELLIRAVDADRAEENNARKLAAKEACEVYIEACMPEHERMLTDAIVNHKSKAPYSLPVKNKRLELVPPTLAEVEAYLVNKGVPKTPTEGSLKSLSSEIATLKGANPNDVALSDIAEAVDKIIVHQDHSGMLKIVKDNSGTISASSKFQADAEFSPAAWLEVIAKIPASKQLAAMTHLCRVAKCDIPTPKTPATEQPLAEQPTAEQPLAEQSA